MGRLVYWGRLFYCFSQNIHIKNRLTSDTYRHTRKVKVLGLDEDKYEEITNDIFQAFKVYEEVYTELG